MRLTIVLLQRHQIATIHLKKDNVLSEFQAARETIVLTMGTQDRISCINSMSGTKRYACIEGVN